MSIAALPPSILLEDIFEFTTEVEIISYYLNLSEIPCLIKSPLRMDSHPSFSIYTPNGKNVKFVDFGTGEYGNCFSLLQALWNLSFREVISRIYLDLPKITKNPTLKVNISNFQYKDLHAQGLQCPKTQQLKVTIRNWQSYDLEYWESFGVSKPWLEFGKIFPISHIFIQKEGKAQTVWPAHEYAYVFVENKDNIESIKIYQPYHTFKWLNNHDSSVWDLWEQLPASGEKLIITSSRKDALSIWENSGIPSCSMQSERQLPKKQVIEELKSRFKRVFILYDNDFNKPINTGREYGSKIAKEFDIQQIELPAELECKDSSDFCHKYGRKQLQTQLLTLTK